EQVTDVAAADALQRIGLVVVRRRDVLVDRGLRVFLGELGEHLLQHALVLGAPVGERDLALDRAVGGDVLGRRLRIATIGSGPGASRRDGGEPSGAEKSKRAPPAEWEGSPETLLVHIVLLCTVWRSHHSTTRIWR